MGFTAISLIILVIGAGILLSPLILGFWATNDSPQGFNSFKSGAGTEFENEWSSGGSEFSPEPTTREATSTEESEMGEAGFAPEGFRGPDSPPQVIGPPGGPPGY